MANRLADETSPYLLQHRDNPVDWYPWGPEALDRARSENKPILLSVGYAACHWCHVMEKESFEDPDTAALMNRDFICIKVDREERPDIDAIYMEAVQAMTGHGGWPMTVFLDSEARPFYGGTYYPPEDRYGMPSFRKVLQAVADAWVDRRGEVEQQSRVLLDHIGVVARLQVSSDPIDAAVLDEAASVLEGSFDSLHGGFGGAPKFPQAPTLEFLSRLERRGRPEAEQMLLTTLTRMAAGGMFDQLLGGFHRYAVDREWIVPHFEKMLYDNALLLRVYARAWQTSGEERFRQVVRDTVDWLLAEMQDPAGGFYSSLDADSEGEEGRFYVWSLDEVTEVAGSDAPLAIAYWGITPEGNFEGSNIPIFAGSLDEADPEARERARRALLARRALRERPAADTKVIACWNAMAAGALAEAAVILGERAWLDAARGTLEFIRSTLIVDGRLMRSYRDGLVRHRAYSEDYAATLEASLTLYEATFDLEWLRFARWTADEAIRLFGDPENGGFFSTGSDAEALVVRPKDLFDGPMPSANSIFALELQRLALFTGADTYAQTALECLRLARHQAARAPLGFGHLLSAVDFYTSEPLEIVIVGNLGSDETDSLLNEVRRRFIPNKVLIVAPDASSAEEVPLLEHRARSNGRSTAYVCRRGVCKAPVSTPSDLAAALKQ
ncbi:MAG: thioredoxin domain-containing protein [Actinomycetota bacterium]